MIHLNPVRAMAFQESNTDESNAGELLGDGFAFDPFVRGTLPKLSTNFDRAEKEHQLLSNSDQATISIIGTLSEELPETANQISVQLFHISPAGRERVWGVSKSIRENRQFGMTAFPPQRGWPIGMMIARVAVSDLEVVSKEYPLWIMNLDAQPQLNPPEKLEVRKLMDVAFARVNVTIDFDRVRRVQSDAPVCICGRFPRPEGFTANNLVFNLKHNGIIRGGGIVHLLEDHDGLWFETFINMKGNEFRPGVSTLEFHVPGGTQGPPQIGAIKLSTEDVKPAEAK